jgi:hypothetical protein
MTRKAFICHSTRRTNFAALNVYQNSSITAHVKHMEILQATMTHYNIERAGYNLYCRRLRRDVSKTTDHPVVPDLHESATVRALLPLAFSHPAYSLAAITNPISLLKTIFMALRSP